MSLKILESALAEWKYASNLTLKSIEAIPPDQWQFSPHPLFAPFSKQIRHVLCCRGVFAEGFQSRKIDFSKKHLFYSGSLERNELLAALHQSTSQVHEILGRLEKTDLDYYKADYYGEDLGFVEHFSALVCHEATHRGFWSVYSALGGFYQGKPS